MAPLDAAAVVYDPENEVHRQVRDLNRRFEGVGTVEMLRTLWRDVFPGSLAMVSSFGAESAVLLHLVAEADADAPVLFVDTEKLFGETKRYRDTLIGRFGLNNVQTILPDPDDIAAVDGDGGLWMRDTDRCCHVRKVLPLEKALAGYDAWITGRKRFQSATRASLDLFEADGARIKVNPLAHWTPDDLKTYAETHDLPPHPLVAQGFLSIGCMPCTERVREGEDPRAGRWRGQEKTECGIHLPTHGREFEGSGI